MCPIFFMPSQTPHIPTLKSHLSAEDFESLAFTFQLPSSQTMAPCHLLVLHQSSRKWIERKDRGEILEKKVSGSCKGILFAMKPLIYPRVIGLNEWAGLFSGWPNMAIECLSAQWQSLRAPKTLGDEMDRELVKCPVLFCLCSNTQLRVGDPTSLNALCPCASHFRTIVDSYYSLMCWETYEESTTAKNSRQNDNNL